MRHDPGADVLLSHESATNSVNNTSTLPSFPTFDGITTSRKRPPQEVRAWQWWISTSRMPSFNNGCVKWPLYCNANATSCIYAQVLPAINQFTKRRVVVGTVSRDEGAFIVKDEAQLELLASLALEQQCRCGVNRVAGGIMDLKENVQNPFCVLS
jgi:hypothetical protein